MQKNLYKLQIMPLKFSKIIAGAMNWGVWGKNMNTSEMASLIQFCVNQEITTFDHADIYGGYTTEAAFGKALSESGVQRDHIQLISKCGIQYEAENRDIRIKHYNYSKDYIVWSVEQSLKHLQTDYLDALLLHRPSPLMHPHEVMEAVAKLAQEGKIRDFGVSNFTPSQVDLIGSEVPVTINQIEFSVTHLDPMFDGVLDQTIAKNITPMAWSPLGSVFSESSDRVNRIKSVLKDLCEKYNATMDQLLIAWILKHPASVYPVVGTTREDRLATSIQSAGIDLDIQDWFSILVASQGHKVP